MVKPDPELSPGDDQSIASWPPKPGAPAPDEDGESGQPTSHPPAGTQEQSWPPRPGTRHDRPPPARSRLSPPGSQVPDHPSALVEPGGPGSDQPGDRGPEISDELDKLELDLGLGLEADPDGEHDDDDIESPTISLARLIGHSDQSPSPVPIVAPETISAKLSPPAPEAPPHIPPPPEPPPSPAPAPSLHAPSLDRPRAPGEIDDLDRDHRPPRFPRPRADLTARAREAGRRLWPRRSRDPATDPARRALLRPPPPPAETSSDQAPGLDQAPDTGGQARSSTGAKSTGAKRTRPTGSRQPEASVRDRVTVPLLAVASGLAVAASLPPIGLWPLAFIGIAGLDHLIADQLWMSRFARAWIAAAAWLYPSTLFMWDLTAPGYVVAGAFFSTYIALAAALAPPGRERRLVLPFTVALAELVRWSWPFGGTPLAHLALSQVDTPLLALARVGGSLAVVAAVVAVGQSLSAFISRETYHGALGLAGVLALLAVTSVAPGGSPVGEIDVALVQGGGPQRTRASAIQQPIVLGRHLEASRLIRQPVDLVIWPENVVNPGQFLTQEDARAAVEEVAVELDAAVLAGWFYAINDEDTVNYQSTITPEGNEIDRYDKVKLVPFGEYVPLRSVVEALNDEIPRHDVVVGTAEPVLDTPVGPVGVAISWEGFFETRNREAARGGALVLSNPTNGASYWLTQVQAQQVASNQLRAVENDRWVLQVAPTGYSAVIDADGNVLQQTEISERAVLVATVEQREGQTLATRYGFWPMLIAAAVSITVGYRSTRPRRVKPTRARG